MAAARKDVAEAIVGAPTEFEQRCVGRNPAFAQVQTLGSLLIARSSASPAPTEKKGVIQNPGSLRYARAKRQHVLEAKRSVLEYIIEKGTGGRVTARDIFVHSDYSVESSRWTDFLIFAFDCTPEEA